MTEDDLVGKQFGEYRLEALLGQGGMARVYRAMDVRLKRLAVIKLIDPPSRNDPDYLMRFEREAQIIGQLDHPNIVRLYRFDEQDDWLYMAMQHVDGTDLGVVLENYRADKVLIEPNEARRIIREICSALDYAHRKGVIHRDVKPANILLDRQGRAFLSDFGLALITEIGTRGEIFGSAHYIAPEQAVSSAKAVPQSDLYAIGIILYEMFTGELPFQAERPLDIAFLQITEPPVPPRQLRPEINPELEAVILKSLAKKPEERYQTGAELADALDAALDARSAASLFTPAAASRQSISERVVLELEEQPLPLIPAAVATPIPLAPAEKSVIAKSIAPPTNKRPLVYTGVAIGLGMVLLFVILCLAMIALPPILKGFQTGIGQLLATDGTQIEATMTLGASTTALANPSKESLATSTKTMVSTLPPTASPVSYKLLIVRGQGNDSIVVVNQSESVFSLGLLRLGDAQGSISGTEWGVAELESGACVGAWKQNKGNAKNKLPDGLNCQLVGNSLLKDKKNWLGERPFAVYYDGKQVGICNKDQNQCLITIAP